MSQQDETYLPVAADVRARYGNVSDMWLHRRLNNPASGFPKPIYLGRQRYWRLADLIEWEIACARRSGYPLACGRMKPCPYLKKPARRWRPDGLRRCSIGTGSPNIRPVIRFANGDVRDRFYGGRARRARGCRHFAVRIRSRRHDRAGRAVRRVRGADVSG